MTVFGIHFEWWMFVVGAPVIASYTLTGWGVFPLRPGLVMSAGLQVFILGAIAVADQKGWLS